MDTDMLWMLAEELDVAPRVRTDARCQIREGRVMTDRSTRVLRTYAIHELGRDLYEAGHVTGGREQAVGPEPFKWDRTHRDMAYHGQGCECDDRAAFPRARMAMAPEGRQISETFLRHRKHIMRVAGAYLFAEPDEAERYQRMKTSTNGFDMDSALDAWARKYDNPYGRTLRGHKVALPDGRTFSLQDYWVAQSKTTAWMAARLPGMI